MKSSKNVIPKGKRKTIDSNIDQLEAEVAAILESEVSEKFMLEEEKPNEVRSRTNQTTTPSRK